jgi:hypothetical protein
MSIRKSNSDLERLYALITELNNCVRGVAPDLENIETHVAATEEAIKAGDHEQVKASLDEIRLSVSSGMIETEHAHSVMAEIAAWFNKS